MASVVVELTTNLQQLNILVNAKRTADSLPAIPSHAKVRRITGGGAGNTFVARSPLPTDTFDYRLAENEATPIYGQGSLASENLNCWWLKGENNGDLARIEIEY